MPNPTKPEAERREEQRMQAENAAAKDAAARHRQPHDIAENTRMKRQNKKQHQKTGK